MSVSLHFIGHQRATKPGGFSGLFELVSGCELALFSRQTLLVPGFLLVPHTAVFVPQPTYVRTA